MLMIKSYNW